MTRAARHRYYQMSEDERHAYYKMSKMMRRDYDHYLERMEEMPAEAALNSSKGWKIFVGVVGGYVGVILTILLLNML